jgi:hypothetical protein
VVDLRFLGTAIVRPPIMLRAYTRARPTDEAPLCLKTFRVEQRGEAVRSRKYQYHNASEEK